MVEKSNILKILDMDIMDLDLNQEICNILHNNKIKMVEDVVCYTEEEMLHILGKNEYLEELSERLTLLEVEFKHNKSHKDIVKTIEDLDLSVRAYNVLKRAGINTVAELVCTDISEIRRRIDICLNRKVFDEILLKIKESGLQLQENANKEVEKLGFTPKLAIILRRNGINTANDLSRENLLNIRHIPQVGRKAFKEIVLKLDELGFNPIEIETKKLDELKKTLEIEKHQEETLSSPIEIENIEVNNGYKLNITFSSELKEDWIEIFKKWRSGYWVCICKSNDDEHISSTAEIMAANLIASIQLEAGKATASCLVEELFKIDNHKEVLAYFIEGLNKILKNTHIGYSKRIKEDSVKLRQFEIEEIEWNIDFMKSVFTERDKRIVLNNELSDLMKTRKETYK